MLSRSSSDLKSPDSNCPMTTQRKAEIIEYLQIRIKKLEQEMRESVAVHGMPSYQMHWREVRISALEAEIKLLKTQNPTNENQRQRR